MKKTRFLFSNTNWITSLVKMLSWTLQIQHSQKWKQQQTNQQKPATGHLLLLPRENSRFTANEVTQATKLLNIFLTVQHNPVIRSRIKNKYLQILQENKHELNGKQEKVLIYHWHKYWGTIMFKMTKAHEMSVFRKRDQTSSCKCIPA